MSDKTKPIEFKHEESGTVFEATLVSDAAPEGSWFQWVLGLPETLQKPGVRFTTTKGPGMATLTVGEGVSTGDVVRDEHDAVLCQVTSVASQQVIDDFAANNPDFGRDAAKAGVAETVVRKEVPLTSMAVASPKGKEKK